MYFLYLLVFLYKTVSSRSETYIISKNRFNQQRLSFDCLIVLLSENSRLSTPKSHIKTVNNQTVNWRNSSSKEWPLHFYYHYRRDIPLTLLIYSIIEDHVTLTSVGHSVHIIVMTLTLLRINIILCESSWPLCMENIGLLIHETYRDLSSSK